jgi:hypothetical protein
MSGRSNTTTSTTLSERRHWLRSVPYETNPNAQFLIPIDGLGLDAEHGDEEDECQQDSCRSLLMLRQPRPHSGFDLPRDQVTGHWLRV